MEIQVLDRAGLELYDNEIKAWVTELIASSISRVGDDKIVEHNSSPDSHSDIRSAISSRITETNVDTKIEQHDSSNTAHSTLLSNYTTASSVASAISNHNNNESAHSNILGDISDIPTVSENVIGYIDDVSESVDTLSDQVLHLTGGQMTGTIYFKNIHGAFRNTTDAKSITVFGGTNSSGGAYITLNGKESDSQGKFNLYATNGTNSSLLQGIPNGSLKWNGSEVLTASNGASYILPSHNSDSSAHNNIASTVSTIAGKIPTQASSSNQLADKNFVNSSIENAAAYYITKNTAGDPFATKAELTAATTFYSGGVVRTPVRNDYCIVLADESQSSSTTSTNPTTRYLYNGSSWDFQYIVNNSGFTAAQLAALNSNITSSLVSDISNYSTDIAGKLSLSGGTMTGSILMSSGNLISKNDTNLAIWAGTASDSATWANRSAYLSLCSKNFTGNEGMFVLGAYDGTNIKTLIGKPDGTLTWVGNTVLTTDNGLIKNSGTLADKVYYTPQSNNYFDLTSTVTTGCLTINGGSSAVSGARLLLYGQDWEDTNKASFVLSARNSSVTKSLIGKTDGTLTWVGNTVLTTANGLQLTGGTMTGNILISDGKGVFGSSNSGAIYFCSGNASANGAFIKLFGKDAATSTGNFYIVANNGSDAPTLMGTPSGSLTWNGNSVLTTTNGLLKSNGVMTGGFKEATVALTSSDTAINLNSGNCFTDTITANKTYTFTNATGCTCFSLVLTNGGAYTITWPGTVKWASGTAPTLTSSGVDVLTFITPNGGTNWYGNAFAINASVPTA